MSQKASCTVGVEEAKMMVPKGGTLYIGSPNPKLKKIVLDFGEYGVLEVPYSENELFELTVGEKKPLISGVFEE